MSAEDTPQPQMSVRAQSAIRYAATSLPALSREQARQSNRYEVTRDGSVEQARGARAQVDEVR